MENIVSSNQDRGNLKQKIIIYKVHKSYRYKRKNKYVSDTVTPLVALSQKGVPER